MYSPADSRRTPYVGRNHGDDGDDDFDDAANTYDDAADIYIMMQCLFVTKNEHFLLGVSCNHP